MEDPLADEAADGWALVDDPEILAAAAARAEASHAAEEQSEPPLVVSFLALVDATASRVLEHPIRPRVRTSPTGLLRGELDLVQVEIPAVLASGLVIDRVVVRAEHLRVVPGFPPRLQAQPVSARAYVSQDNVDRWVRSSRLPIKLALKEDGVRLTTTVRGVRMTDTLADLEVTGRFLRLTPKQMTIVGLPAPLARFFRGYLPLPPLPRGARLTGVRHTDGSLAVTFALDALDEALTPDIARRLRSFSRMPIPGL
jgi:hypothetical protein